MRTTMNCCLALAALFATPSFAGPEGAAEPAMTELIQPPSRLCIYYGQPSEVNDSTGDTDRAIAAFMNCDLIVLGDGLEHPQHEDHQAAIAIITALAGAGKAVFGYVDLGVTTQNLDEASLRRYVDEWHRIGATGIFFDDAGYDFGVTRARQNALVDYVHGLGLSVFMNAWNIEDVLGDLDEANQPDPPRLREGDWYLAESWLVGAGVYQPLEAWSRKADKAQHYSRTKGVRIAAVSTAGVRKAAPRDHRHRKFGLAWWGAAMYGIAAWQWTDAAYGAANDVLRIYNAGAPYGTRFLDAEVRYSAVSKSYMRATDAGRIYVKATGGTARGGFSK